MSRKLLALSVAAVLLSAGGNALAAGDAAAGKAKAAICAACHGANGVGTAPMYPNLAGQKEAYLAKQLTDFRAGSRADPIMAGFAKPLSDQDIANLAAYYSGLK